MPTIFVCQQCGKTSPKWQGHCESCGAWNSYSEEAVITAKKGMRKTSQVATTPISLKSVVNTKIARISTGNKEVDQVLGGGIVAGSLVLLGGEPGIGKSTLLLQIAAHVSDALYISGEESLEQIAERARRLNISTDMALLQETDMSAIAAVIESTKPSLVVIDSIQTVVNSEFPSAAGSIVQVRGGAMLFQNIAKSTGVPIVLVGHVTREGTIAGPRTLEHIVDVVLSFEGDTFHNARILKGIKNRFGATNEVAILSMDENGLESVANPSALFLSQKAESVPGSAVTCILEGNRPLLLEVQALTVLTSFGYPKRTAVGMDLNRLQILIAVLQRRANLKLESSDVYVNVVGGLRLADPSADVAICLAIASSFLNKSLPKHLMAIGEVGLLGEIRNVARQQNRLTEAKRLGFGETVSAKTVKDALQQYL